METTLAASEWVVQHIQCPKCSSSDGYSINDRGWGKCFVCDVSIDTKNKEDRETSERGLKSNSITPVTTVYREIKDRALPASAVKKYKIDVNTNPDVDVAHRYPYYHDGRHIGNKVRKRSEKGFWWEAESKDAINGCELFGQDLFPAGGKAVTLVEGELDAASAFVLLGSLYPVVSVSSSSQALRDVKNNYEYLDAFDEIVICFDADVAKINPLTGATTYPGQDAAKRVADLFKPGKCRVLTLREGKDPNDYLKKGNAKGFTKEWWRAPPHMPDGLIMGTELLQDILKEDNSFTVPFPFKGLNYLTYGIRLSEMITITAETKIGKSSILRAIEYALLMNPDLKEKNYGLGVMALEEPKKDTGLGLLSIHNQKPYHLPDTPRTVEEITTAYNEVLNNKRFVLWDHFGSNSVDAVIGKVRHMAALGCKYIILDHLSIIVSDQSGDERKQLDEVSTKLKTLCMELNIALICVIHQNRAGQVKGTSNVEQISNIVIKLYRNKLDADSWRRNVTKVVVEENRFCGRTGPASWLFYDETTGILEELDEEGINRYEGGGTLRDDERAF